MRTTLFSQLMLALVIVLLTPGCATILSKSIYPVYFHINPVGTSISITDKKGKEVYRGKSPTTVKLKSGAGFFSKAEYQVTLSSPGYDEKIVPIYFKLNGWYFGNILVGGFIGMLIVDPATGAMWKIADPLVDETLQRKNVSNATEPTLNVVNINTVSAEVIAKLVRVN